ncbi:hypothetical protein HY494_02235 [Candidatus Woesearchaeota archaeon]|nr:hypothetical protein [Candidatus Woesearchaeota archaeon]
METYKLSIEDEKNIRVVRVEALNLVCERRYGPNAEPASLDYDGNRFDTLFSIVHPFRHVAAEVVRDCFRSHQLGRPRPEMKYDYSVNEQQRTLFENILSQEYQKLREQVKQQEAIRPWR